MNYNLMREHIGHKIVCVCYGKTGEDPDNIAIECETCGEVLIDACAGDYWAKYLAEEQTITNGALPLPQWEHYAPFQQNKYKN